MAFGNWARILCENFVPLAVKKQTKKNREIGEGELKTSPY